MADGVMKSTGDKVVEMLSHEVMDPRFTNGGIDVMTCCLWKGRVEVALYGG